MAFGHFLLLLIVAFMFQAAWVYEIQNIPKQPKLPLCLPKKKTLILPQLSQSPKDKVVFNLWVVESRKTIN